MRQVSGGITPEPQNPADTMVYVTMQELATRIAHMNTGKLLTDRAGYEVMARVAADENLHYLFYRGITDAALQLDPSTVVLAIDRQTQGFDMPGTGIADFPTHARRIAQVGIYDFVQHHDHILLPLVMRHWKVESIEGLSGEADEARERLVRYVSRVGKAAQRLKDRRGDNDDAEADPEGQPAKQPERV